MLRSAKCIMAGDHCQLPPTIKSQKAEAEGLGDTLFQFLIDRDKEKICTRMLDTQYRMNDIINQWASNEMYAGLLKSHPNNANHTLYDLKDHISELTLGELGSCVMLLVDTSGCSLQEDGGIDDGGSYRNEGEGKLVLQHIQCLVDGGIDEADIGVITPYNAQVQLIKLLVRESPYPNVQVKSVDGFQGGEKEAIILSFVRSNDVGCVGFLADKRRINVAITRAKRHLAVICDAETCSSDPFLGRFIQYISEYGEHRSAAEILVKDVVAAEYSGPQACETLSDVVCETTGEAALKGTDRIDFKPHHDGQSVVESSRTSKKKKKSKKLKADSASAVADTDHIKIIGLKDILPSSSTVEEKSKIRHSFQRVIEKFVDGSLNGGTVDVYSISDGVSTYDNNWIDESSVRGWLNTLSRGDKTVTVTGYGEGGAEEAAIVFVVNHLFSMCLEFPISLTSFHRLIIHELSEAASLRHISVDGSEGRHIEVYKQFQGPEVKAVLVEDEKKISAAGYDILQGDEQCRNDSSSEVKAVLVEDEKKISAAGYDILQGDEQCRNNSSSDSDTEKVEEGNYIREDNSYSIVKNSTVPKKSKKLSKLGKKSEDKLDDMAFLDQEIAKNKVRLMSYIVFC